MSWRLTITAQQRGTKAETTLNGDFDSRESAEAAAEKLEDDLRSASPGDMLKVAGPSSRQSFFKDDFRRTRVAEKPTLI